jgi:hypothetical protein
MTDQKDSGPQAGTADWNGCAPGVLTGFSKRVHRRQLLILAAKTVGATGCVVAAGLGGWMEYLRRQEISYQYKGMTCSDVRELLPSYLNGRLDAKRSEVLEKHVLKCSTCANLRSKLRTKSV